MGPKNKGGRPKGARRKLDKRKVIKSVIKHKGVLSQAARELNIAPQNVSQFLKNNPDVKQTIQERINSLLDNVGLTEQATYQILAEESKAKKFFFGKQTEEPNWRVRAHAVDRTLELRGHLKPVRAPEGGTPINFIQIVVPPKEQLPIIDLVPVPVKESLPQKQTEPEQTHVDAKG